MSSWLMKKDGIGKNKKDITNDVFQIFCWKPLTKVTSKNQDKKQYAYNDPVYTK